LHLQFARDELSQTNGDLEKANGDLEKARESNGALQKELDAAKV